MPMHEPAPLTFTDEQLLAALKAGPEAILAQVSVIAMQMELVVRRHEDDEKD